MPIPAVCLYSVHTHSLHTISLKNHLPKPPPSHHLLASEHPSIKPNSMPAPNKGKWLPRPLLGSDGPSGVWEILVPPALVCLEGKFWACRLLSFLVKEHFDTSRLAPPNFYRLQGFPSIQFKDNLWSEVLQIHDHHNFFTDSEPVEALLAAVDGDHGSSSISFCNAPISLQHNHLKSFL